MPRALESEVAFDGKNERANVCSLWLFHRDRRFFSSQPLLFSLLKQPQNRQGSRLARSRRKGPRPDAEGRQAGQEEAPQGTPVERKGDERERKLKHTSTKRRRTTTTLTSFSFSSNPQKLNPGPRHEAHQVQPPLRQRRRRHGKEEGPEQPVERR